MSALVAYTLTATDADTILRYWQSHGVTGNKPSAGDTCPALVVHQWSASTANLTVFPDGPGSVWLTSRPYGTGEGTWREDPGVAGPTQDQAPEPVAVDGGATS